GPGYQTDFSTVTDFFTVRTAGENRRLILSTFDHQLAVWWLAFKRQYLFVPDVFISTLPQAEIENRFGANCQLIGISPNECLGLLLDIDKWSSMDNPVANFFFGSALYHTNKSYSRDAEESYLPEQIASTRRTGLERSWHLQISQPEQLRLST